MFGRKEPVAPLAAVDFDRPRPVAAPVAALDQPCDCGQTTIGACATMDARHCGQDEPEDTIAEFLALLTGPDRDLALATCRNVLNDAEKAGSIKLVLSESLAGKLEVFKLTPKVVHTVDEELLP